MAKRKSTKGQNNDQQNIHKTKEGLIRLANILQYNEKCQLYKPIYFFSFIQYSPPLITSRGCGYGV
jgi:hypothetical protein